MRLDIAKQRSTDLLNRRFAAYGKLWLQMHPLAVYSSETFNADAARSTSKDLSNWYFSDSGGLFLSTTARDFYFALQDTLKTFSDAVKLQKVPHIDGRNTFTKMLKLDKAIAWKYRKCVQAYEDEQPERMPGKDWLHLCRELSPHALKELAKDPVHGSSLAFCMAQQVSSALRTRLAHELQTRLDSTSKWWRFW